MLGFFHRGSHMRLLTIITGKRRVKNFFAIDPWGGYNEWLWITAVSYFTEGSY